MMSHELRTPLNAIAGAVKRRPEYFPAGVPVETEPGAFFYCARQVSRKMQGRFSVETFDAPRPYTQVTETLRRKSKECLDVTVESSGTVRQGNRVSRAKT